MQNNALWAVDSLLAQAQKEIDRSTTKVNLFSDSTPGCTLEHTFRIDLRAGAFSYSKIILHWTEPPKVTQIDLIREWERDDELK